MGLVFAAGFMLAGCHPRGSAGAAGESGTAGPSATTQQGSAATAAPVSLGAARGYSILYDLMSDESRVGGIFLLKRVTPETHKLIKEIAAVSADAAKHLKPHAGAPVRWPKLETLSRDAIEKATRHRLLSTSGTRFEVELLLTQTNATEYGSSLAQQLATLVPSPDEKAWLTQLSRSYKDLNRRAAGRLTLAP